MRPKLNREIKDKASSTIVALSVRRYDGHLRDVVFMLPQDEEGFRLFDLHLPQIVEKIHETKSKISKPISLQRRWYASYQCSSDHDPSLNWWSLPRPKAG